MKRRCLTMLLCCPLLASAQTIAVKTGAWEMTYKGAAFPRPVVEKDCVTKADLEQLARAPDDEDGDCKFVRPPTITANKWSGEKRCPDGRTVRAEFVAESPERIAGTVTSPAPKGGQVERMEISGRWLGASCAGID